MKTTTLLNTIGALSLGALLVANAFGDSNLQSSSEPQRIYNLASRNFEPNPDYHAPAYVRMARQAGEAPVWHSDDRTPPRKPVFKTKTTISK